MKKDNFSNSVSHLEPKIGPDNDIASCYIKQEFVTEPFDPNQPVDPNFTEFSVVLQQHGEEPGDISKRSSHSNLTPIINFQPNPLPTALPVVKIEPVSPVQSYASVVAGTNPTKAVQPKQDPPKLPSLPTVDELQEKPSTSSAVPKNSDGQQKVWREHPPGWQLVRKRRGSGELDKHKSEAKRPNYGTDIVCHECHKTFGRRGGLIQHVKSKHSGPLPFLCGQCGKRFQESKQLEAHLEKHNMTDKPFKCQVQGCNSQFVHKNDLARHVQGSHGEARFGCSECAKRFVRHDHLLVHEQSHERKRQRAANPGLFPKRGRKKREE